MREARLGGATAELTNCQGEGVEYAERDTWYGLVAHTMMRNAKGPRRSYAINIASGIC